MTTHQAATAAALTFFSNESFMADPVPSQMSVDPLDPDFVRLS
jgi:hypothetical protein